MFTKYYQKNVFLGAILFSLLVLTACPAKNKSPSNGPLTKIVYMGDPMNLVKGAELNNKIDLSFFKDSEPVYLTGVVDFYSIDSYQLKKTITQANLETENAAQTKAANEEIEGAARFSVLLRGTGDIQLRLQNADLSSGAASGSIDIVLHTYNTKQNKTIIGLYENGKSAGDAELLHYSISKNKNVLSLLIKIDNDIEHGQYLEAIYFTKKIESEKPPTIVNDSLMYIFGPGAKVGWSKERTLNINLCGQEVLRNKSILEQEIDQWRKAIGGRLKIHVSESETYKPFSDLNQHCIYFVDDLKLEPDSRASKFGVTMPIFDYGNLNIIDADFILFKSEFKKWNVEYDDLGMITYFHKTILHEMGHFFGLDHQFDPAVPSIMSYSFDGFEPKLEDYDIRAIQALYAP